MHDAPNLGELDFGDYAGIFCKAEHGCKHSSNKPQSSRVSEGCGMRSFGQRTHSIEQSISSAGARIPSWHDQILALDGNK